MGRYGHRYINSDKRLKSPMIRENGKLVETSWDKALGFVADRLSEIKDKSGADAVAGVTSGICLNEDAYLFQKFMRETVGSANVTLSGADSLDRAAAIRLSSMRGELRSLFWFSVLPLQQIHRLHPCMLELLPEAAGLSL